MIYFGDPSGDTPIAQLCLTALNDSEGRSIVLSRDLPHGGPLYVNPGSYELVIARCLSGCSDRLHHDKLVLRAEDRHRYRVQVEDLVNILESTSLDIVARDAKTGAVVATAPGKECTPEGLYHQQ